MESEGDEIKSRQGSYNFSTLVELTLVEIALVEIALVRDLPVHGMMKDLLGQSTDFKGHLKT